MPQRRRGCRGRAPQLSHLQPAQEGGLCPGHQVPLQGNKALLGETLTLVLANQRAEGDESDGNESDDDEEFDGAEADTAAGIEEDDVGATRAAAAAQELELEPLADAVAGQAMRTRKDANGGSMELWGTSLKDVNGAASADDDVITGAAEGFSLSATPANSDTAAAADAGGFSFAAAAASAIDGADKGTAVAGSPADADDSNWVTGRLLGVPG